MRLPQFTPQQPIPDVQTTPQEYELDPEIIIKHDDLNARAWEREYAKPFFDNHHDESKIPNSHKIAVRSDLAVNETSTNPGAIEESSLKSFPQADRLFDGTDTDHYMEPDARTSKE